MKKKLLIGVLILSIIVFGVVFYWWHLIQKDRIRKDILTSLEEKFEFCEIIKENINVIGGTGSLWLICNNRPFYIEYDGNVSYDLNGWGFLKKDSNVWNELSNCDFYDSRDSQLIFYCPKDFDSAVLTAKLYRFDDSSLKMEKLEEKNFLEVTSDDIASIYGFLSKCKIENFHSTKTGDYPAVLLMTFNCEHWDYLIATDLQTIPLQPPILINSNLTNEQKARISFEKSFGCEINDITSQGSEVKIESICKEREFIVTYRFTNTPFLLQRIKCLEDESKACIRDFGKYFILPPFEKMEEVELIRLEYGNFIYKVGNELLSLRKDGDYIIYFWRNTGGLYR